MENNNHTNIEEINLLDYLNIFWKSKKLILTIVFIVTTTVTILSLIMPKTFRSKAVLMPPTNEDSGILGNLTSLPLGNLFSSSAGDETSRIIAILNSRTVMESIVSQLNLIDEYKADHMEHAVQLLRGMVTFEITDEGTIIIISDAITEWMSQEENEINARNLSMQMTNRFILELDKVNKSLNTKQAKFSREFIESRYYQNIEDLTLAEDNYRKFLEDNDMIILEEQAKVAINAAAEIKEQIIQDEVQLGVLSNSLNQDHPEIIRLKDEIDELELQLDNMEIGSNSLDDYNKDLFPALSKVPDLGINLKRFERDIEIQNTIFAFLTQQYEEAKIKEARDTPTIQVLDEANYPEKRDKPKRKLLVIGGFMLSLFFSMILSVFLERIK